MTGRMLAHDSFKVDFVLCKYLRLFIQGVGNLAVTLIGTGGVMQTVLPLATAPAIPLANPVGEDIESFYDFRSEEEISIMISQQLARDLGCRCAEIRNVAGARSGKAFEKGIKTHEVFPLANKSGFKDEC